MTGVEGRGYSLMMACCLVKLQHSWALALTRGRSPAPTRRAGTEYADEDAGERTICARFGGNEAAEAGEVDQPVVVIG